MSYFEHSAVFSSKNCEVKKHQSLLNCVGFCLCIVFLGVIYLLLNASGGLDVQQSGKILKKIQKSNFAFLYSFKFLSTHHCSKFSCNFDYFWLILRKNKKTFTFSEGAGLWSPPVLGHQCEFLLKTHIWIPNFVYVHPGKKWTINY